MMLSAVCVLGLAFPGVSAVARPAVLASPVRAARPPHAAAAAAVRMGSVAEAPLFRVYLLNDSFNMREYVARVLMFVCELTAEQANEIMMEANFAGQAVVGEYEKAVAEHVYSGMKQARLEAAIAQADDLDESSLYD